MNDIVTVIFSKDRPLQLDLTLKSNHLHNRQWVNMPEIVLYKPTDGEYRSAYKNVQTENYPVDFVEEQSFREDLVNIVKRFEYVIFLVDDTIFVRQYSPFDIKEVLQRFSNVVGFSLRLGSNTTYCYPHDAYNAYPTVLEIDSNKDMMIFDWLTCGFGDFSYPLELSSSMYRVKDIIGLLKTLDYSNPNMLEWKLSLHAKRDFSHKPVLASYNTSVAFSNPLNRVQEVNNNRALNYESFHPKNLLRLYNDGWRADPNQFKGFLPIGCHQEVPFEDIDRWV